MLKKRCEIFSVPQYNVLVIYKRYFLIAPEKMWYILRLKINQS